MVSADWADYNNLNISDQSLGWQTISILKIKFYRLMVIHKKTKFRNNFVFRNLPEAIFLTIKNKLLK